MNLLEGMMYECVMMDRSTVSGDRLGGFDTVWTEGAAFRAYVRKDTADTIKVAEQQGVKEMFTVIVPRSVNLEFHDVFKRVSDGAIFRLTSNVKDATAPGASSVEIGKATCERWELI